MKKAQKWNFAKRDYDEYDLPENSSCFEVDMDTIISCAQCGKKMTFGEGYTSRQIHTHGGAGYSVCEACYEKEYNEERKHRNS